MIYSYEAKDEAGRVVTGALDAHDERTAARLVRDLGYFPLRLAPSRLVSSPMPQERMQQGGLGQWARENFWYPLWSGVGLADLAICYRQWATLLRAGVPLARSLAALGAQSRSAALRKSLHAIGETVRQGGTISDGMAQFPWIYTDLHRAMIRAGETTGGLDTMFGRLADSLEQEMALRRTLKRETFYPKIVIAGSFLLPPLFYLVLGQVHAYVQSAVMPLLSLLGIGAGLFVVQRLGSRQRRGYDALTANLPGMGGTVRMVALARFARALASLYSAGVGMPQAIRIAADVCGNAFLGGKMLRAVPGIQAGQDIADALARTGAFPPMVISMIQTGEETGELDAMMDKVAEQFEQEAAVRLHKAGVTVGLVVLGIAAVMVGVEALKAFGVYGQGLNDLMKPDS